MSRIVLGVAGGIAAYKACVLLRMLTESGHDVTVVPTESALQFVGEATWAALSGKPVRTQVWQDAHEVPHVLLGREADLVVVAPATADLLARAATGRADDLLTNVLLTATCPVVMAPAMHTEMWLHPATAANVAVLRSRGVLVLDPADGRLTGADSGPGRLPEPADLLASITAVLADAEVSAAIRRRDLAGKRVLVSAGGTHEHLDPVRFLGNSSSGLMGLALARAAGVRGADVTVVAANLTQPIPSGVKVRRVVSTSDLAAAMTDEAPGADLIVMAAAPADFTPTETSGTKLKKTAGQGISVELVQTVDVLAALSKSRRPGQVIVGFAAETASDEAQLLALGRDKLARKGCDLLVLNDVSGGRVFGSADNQVTIITTAGTVRSVAGDKNLVAHGILDAATQLRTERETSR